METPTVGVTATPMPSLDCLNWIQLEILELDFVVVAWRLLRR